MDDDTDDDLVAPGFCTVCECHVRDSMAVAYVPTGSGPGRVIEACVEHARDLAAYALAPQWLKDDIARLDTPTNKGTRMTVTAENVPPGIDQTAQEACARRHAENPARDGRSPTAHQVHQTHQ